MMTDQNLLVFVLKQLFDLFLSCSAASESEISLLDLPSKVSPRAKTAHHMFPSVSHQKVADHTAMFCGCVLRF